MSLMTDVLSFLKTQQQAEEVALAALRQAGEGYLGGEPMKAYNERVRLIKELESRLTGEQPRDHKLPDTETSLQQYVNWAHKGSRVVQEYQELRHYADQWCAFVEDKEARNEWTAMRVGGGGVFSVPNLPRDEAIDYVLRRGSHQLCTIDDTNKIIFYRSN